MELGLVAAFLGGALALLSPCGALLLPAFFAATTGTSTRLLLNGGVFFVGLSLTLVPLGLGVAAVGSLVTTHRDALILVAGWLVIVFGALQVLGIGFDASRLLPGARTVQGAAGRRTGLVRALLLGTVSGVAGFCSGPILGAVLTLAATQESPLLAGTMLAVYGAGMVVPLLVIAASWNRLGPRGRARLRGRAWQVGPLRLHSTSVVTGLLLIAVGILFLRTNGLASLPGLLPADLVTRAQTGLLSLARAVPETVVIITLAAVALVVWFALDRRAARARAAATEDPVDAAAEDQAP
ncbi:cytochrome c biogenesis protein CcdA [Oerskovia turbata]|uniref:Cytochrome c biogenesis protein CcdA n=1 Tax=Oerskovia turbata TaxID=1713 RepID=A0A4Q1KZ80_9CELL|nr:cytochrome c biogenesis CcdA family protein [Oerskovia turbata]RXR25069.1 cytochrome c biogenesis protein CcdA [Oerskovia turbata]RXR35215.1 cytochrome c biogenesis protein CcdA [Oerskovia turbata]TGJ96452.1 cytochrome c biogenesis protein CcdA [Actinotalea fermentans ATCC 43279 = JCM 9966 = DSM 3133]